MDREVSQIIKNVFLKLSVGEFQGNNTLIILPISTLLSLPYFSRSLILAFLLEAITGLAFYLILSFLSAMTDLCT